MNKIKGAVLLLLVATLLTSTSALASLTDVKFYYINGVQTTEAKAQLAIGKIDNLAGRVTVLQGPNKTIELLHNATAGKGFGLIKDLIESGAVVTEATRLGIKPDTLAWRIFYGSLSVIPSTLFTAVQKLQGDIATLPASASVDVDRWMTDQINPQRLANPFQKIIVFGHSEGTAYSNLVYQKMVQSETPNNTETNNCTQVIQMASIVPSVANGGRYVTGFNDRAIQLVRLRFNNILPANIPSLTDTKGDWFRHGINDVYLFEPNIVAKIKADMTNAGTDLVRDCIAPSCNTSWGIGAADMDARLNVDRLHGPVTMSYRINVNNPGFVAPSAWHADHQAILGGMTRVNMSNVTSDVTGTFVHNFTAGQPDLINLSSEGQVKPNGWPGISTGRSTICVSCGTGSCGGVEGKTRFKQWWLNGSVGNWQCPDINLVDVALNNIITLPGQKIRNNFYFASTNTRGCICQSSFGCPSGIAPRLRYGGTVFEIPALGTQVEIELR